MDQLVHIEQRQAVLLITVAHPPVNALNHAVRCQLLQALQQAQQEASVGAIVLSGAGDIFIGGADIREFGQPRLAPLLSAVCHAIEGLTKPVLAAVHGAALGGGMEIALAAHYRVIGPQAEFALPEVLLGLMPGAGGTQRAPRLMGIPAALDLMLSGRRVHAAQAQTLQLADRQAEDPLQAALVWAAELAAAKPASASLPRVCDKAIPGERAAAQAALDAARASLPTKYKGLLSPRCMIDALQAALDMPFAAAHARESALFLECLASPQRAALIHRFQAERAAARVPEAVQPRPVRRVGVVGGGTMGAGIAVALLDAGLPVTMVERDAAGVAQGQARVQRVYDDLVRTGRLSPEQRSSRLGQFDTAVDNAALSHVELVIEAVFEDMEVKTAVLTELAQVCRPGAVIGTNTSYLDIQVLAQRSGRPQDVIGLHFFSPAHVMKLLEIVTPAAASADAIATGFALAKRMRKVAVRAGVCDGFIGNRLLGVYRRSADYMLADGASPYAIDAAIRQFGFAMGPFAVMDLAGGDIAWAGRKRRAPRRDPRERYITLADQLCERAWFGQKTGRGWYRYPQGQRTGVEDPEVLALIDAERQKLGITPKAFSAEAIVQRYLVAMINEGAKVVEEGIALRPSDVDVVLLNGYGFPGYHGGPMYYADQMGLGVVLQRIEEWAQEDAYFWQPATLLQNLVAQGKNFASLNAGA